MWIEGEGNDDEGGDDAQNTDITKTGSEANQGQDEGGAGDDDGGEGARQPEPTKTEKAVAAFDEGVAEVDGPKGADDDAAAGATGGTAGATAAGDGKGATGAVAKGATAAGATGTDEDPAAEKKAAIEKEIVDLGLKSEKSKKRFRELSERPTWEEVTDQFKPMAELAQQAQQYQAVLEDSGANTQQVGEMFHLLKRINSGDPTQIKEAVDSMYKELKWAAAKIGVRLDAFDPIEQFPDLKADLTDGKITAERAQELMAARRAQGMTAEQRAAADRSQKQQADHKKKVDAAVEEIAQFDATVKADPQYEAKRAMMAPVFDRLRRTKVDHSLWPAEVRQAWSELRVVAPPVVKPKVTPSPIRPNSSAGTVQRPGVPKDPYDAFDQGYDEARTGSSIYD